MEFFKYQVRFWDSCEEKEATETGITAGIDMRDATLKVISGYDVNVNDGKEGGDLYECELTRLPWDDVVSLEEIQADLFPNK